MSTLDNSTRSIDRTGIFPSPIGVVFGFHGITSSGLTIGTGLGFTSLTDTSNDSHSLHFVWLRPRLGYAVSKNPKMGFWLRTGPSVLSGITSESSVHYLNYSFELLGVWTPVEHFGVTLGPFMDLALGATASEGSVNSFKTYGLTVGLVFDSGGTP